MADNTTLNTGTGGDVISTDDLGTVKVQRVKVQYGVDGSATDVSTTNPMPVSDAGGTLSVDDGAGSLTVDGTVTANLAAGTNNIGDVDVLTLPATAADGAVGLPSTTVVVAGYDGTNVQAAVTDSAGRFQVGVNGTVPVTDNSGSLTVDAPVGTPAFVRLSDGAAAITALPITDNAGSLTVDGTVSITANSSVNVAQVAGTTTDTNSGTKSAGTQRVVLATDQPQLTNALKVDGSAVTQPVSGTVAANVTPVTSGGLSISHLVSAATTNATNVKASAGQLYGWYIYNSNAAARKVAFHNSAGTPTAGASILFAIVIPPTSAANVEFTNGIAFGTGIAFTTVTGLTDADATAVAASDLIINLFYK